MPPVTRAGASCCCKVRSIASDCRPPLTWREDSSRFAAIHEPSPGKSGESPADLQWVYEAVAAEDPYHPIAVCIDQPDLEARYLATYDILMIDPYPLVHARRPVSSIGDHLDRTRPHRAG